MGLPRKMSCGAGDECVGEVAGVMMYLAGHPSGLVAALRATPVEPTEVHFHRAGDLYEL